MIAASTNPVKINASRGGFEKMFPNEKFEVSGVSAPSGVSDQPMSSDETLEGATNRAANARKSEPNADYWVGLEGGVEEIDGEMRTVVWAVVLSKERMGKARAASFVVPSEIARLIKEGVELGHADDQVFGTTNSKQQGGAIGILTKNAINRTSVYQDGVILALIPFLNPDLYPSK